MQFKRSSSRVSTGAHSCMRACEKISKLLSFTGDVCLLIINAHRYLARSHADPPPPHPPKPSRTLSRTHTHAAALSVMSCQSLLGLAFSLARGLDPLSEELNSGPFPPQYSKKAASNRQRQTGPERQGPFIVSPS